MTKGTWWSNQHRKYKYRDKKTGLEYNLTLDQARAIMSLPCFYCCDPEARGLDRKSNDAGHILTNVVPCCGKCNLMLASIPWAAKIEMRESLRAVREKGLLGDWRPPYLAQPEVKTKLKLERGGAVDDATSLGAEAELVAAMSEQIGEETDGEIVSRLNQEGPSVEEIFGAEYKEYVEYAIDSVRPPTLEVDLEEACRLDIRDQIDKETLALLESKRVLIY